MSPEERLQRLSAISAIIIRMAAEFGDTPGDTAVVDFLTGILWSPRNILPALREGLILRDEAAKAIVDRAFTWLSERPGAVQLSIRAGDWDHYIDEVGAALPSDR